MEKAVRTELRNVVTKCRKLLEEAIQQLLQGQFGIHRSGEIEDADSLTHLSTEDREYRAQAVVHLEHIIASGFKPQDAVQQLVREVAFTHLNRLCAFKMMEERELLEVSGRNRRAVSQGIKSQGFVFYLADHPEDEKLWRSGQQDIAYRHFLIWLGSTFADEIKALFSPNDPANRLFPPQRVLDQVLELINGDALKDIWSENETIGWIYQYFTPKELRDQARKESAAPRNSYELAFRNQFYTPSYVVQFLSDNTLGRIWYEMRGGATRLEEQCRYLVYRPNEKFLAEGEKEPQAGNGTTIYIPYRRKKDPRDIPILDPAVGSGHFLLYCFGLLQTIYEEAYGDPELGPKLQRDYPEFDAYRKAVPALILRQNLHGIDIDLRATQIAALALWLRAQKAYQELGLRRAQRPPITRSNIVCAEQMPGEAKLLEEFAASLRPKVLGDMLRFVFEKMKLAGEAGSLLKIEEEISRIVAKKKRQYKDEVERGTDKFGNVELLTRAEIARATGERQSALDLSETDEEFWGTAEQRIIDELRRYAQSAANGHGLLRQLFAEDAERGFAFVDICRKRFDVVLMNPPFGDPSIPSRGYIERAYPRTKNDVFAGFIERWAHKLETRGVLGAITSRTGFFLASFQKWREEILLREVRPTVVADLGQGVLDTAMVETAAYCLEAVK